jgi:hypothetical protein
MIELPGRVFEGRSNVLRFEIWIVGQDFIASHTRCKQIKHVRYANAHPADAGSPTALIGIDRNSMQLIHVVTLMAIRLRLL